MILVLECSRLVEDVAFRNKILKNIESKELEQGGIVIFSNMKFVLFNNYDAAKNYASKTQTDETQNGIGAAYPLPLRFPKVNYSL